MTRAIARKIAGVCHGWGTRRAAGFALAVTAVGASVGCAPVFSDFQSARTLGPGKSEITPNFTSTSFYRQGDKAFHSQNNYGLYIAEGVHEFVDVRAGYVRIELEGGDEGINVVAIGPKFALVPGHVALFLPVGAAFGASVDAADSAEWHPTLLLTAHVGRYLELNPSAKILVPFESQRDVLVAFGLGAGLSADFQRWALRPELGILIDPGEEGVFAAYGLGISIYP